MIEKSRLEELIEQGARVWCICDYTYDKSQPNKKIEYYDLSNENMCISPAGFRDYGLRVYEPLGYWNDIRLEYLFETKEDAEWYIEFGNIERTEKLSLPGWNDAQKGISYKFYAPRGRVYLLETKVKTGYSCGRENPYIIRIERIGYADSQIDFEYTKENYLETCRLAKKLFLGEEVEGEIK